MAVPIHRFQKMCQEAQWPWVELPNQGGTSPYDEDIHKMSADSRDIEPGDLFVSMPCETRKQNMRHALEAGARWIVMEERELHALTLSRLPQGREGQGVVYVGVPDLDQALFSLLSLFYPHRPQTVVAVTGTNGKSSVVSFVRQLWALQGRYSVSLGTLGIEGGIDVKKGMSSSTPSLTTPDIVSVHRLLHQVAQQDNSHFVFEASSHGLDQGRLRGIGVHGAGFTNLTHDHLDYHGTLEAYFTAKSKLFSQNLEPQGTAVLPVHSPYVHPLSLLIQSKGSSLITYGEGAPEADLRALTVQITAEGLWLTLQVGQRTWPPVYVPVVGAFQVENLLCAIGLVIGSEWSRLGKDRVQGAQRTIEIQTTVDTLIPLLPFLKSAPGRMQYAGETPAGAKIYIDYAHTPDALKKALETLRPLTQKHLHLVFGCGGNRDVDKRAPMGKIAHECADRIYITDDNPRREDPAYIRAQILEACPGAIEKADREEAIGEALSSAQKGDIVLIAGKGHERGQMIGEELFSFDDEEKVQKICRALSQGHLSQTT